MSKKFNNLGGKKAKGFGRGGMSKHRKSGVAHNHAVSISNARDANRRLEEEIRLREKRKGKVYKSVRELLSSVNE